MSEPGEPNSSSLDLRPSIHEHQQAKIRLRQLLDISPALKEAAGAIVDDSFTRCFKSNPAESWNWNLYLFPLWCCSVVIKYGLLFPLRVIVLAIGWVVFLSSYIPVHFLLKRHDKSRKKIERYLVEMICSFKGSRNRHRKVSPKLGNV